MIGTNIELIYRTFKNLKLCHLQKDFLKMKP